MKISMATILAFLFCISTYAQTTRVTNSSYTVPTDIVELKEFSKFKVSQVDLNEDKISFKLPLGLTSKKTKLVTFERSNKNSNKFSSVFGRAHCLEKRKESIECDVKYNKLYANFIQEELKNTELYLKSLDLPIDEFEKRLEVAKRFAGDPLGVLKISLENY